MVLHTFFGQSVQLKRFFENENTDQIKGTSKVLLTFFCYTYSYTLHDLATKSTKYFKMIRCFSRISDLKIVVKLFIRTFDKKNFYFTYVWPSAVSNEPKLPNTAFSSFLKLYIYIFHLNKILFYHLSIIYLRKIIFSGYSWQFIYEIISIQFHVFFK